MGENHLASLPTATYGIVLLCAAIAYYILQSLIKATEGPTSRLSRVLGTDLKGKASPLLYLISIPVAFVVPWISVAIYVFVALIWLVRDRRIEIQLKEHKD